MPTRLKPFFCFYGGKYRATPRYPKPEYNTIIEPFAGAAGYSVRYFEKKCILYEKDPVIYTLWKYLIDASPDDIMTIPHRVNHINELKEYPEGSQHLVGFWLNKGVSHPCNTPSAWMRSGIRPNSFWGKHIRERVASQVEKIKHWEIHLGSYTTCENKEATWFVDPPYQKMGKHYKEHNVDYDHLRKFVLSRNGQVIVCEQEGADWLPFKYLGTFKANEGSRSKKRTKEVIWCQRT